MDFKRLSPYEINIRHTGNNGIIVRIGCGEFCFSNPDDMTNALIEYYENPVEMERKYNSAQADTIVVSGGGSAAHSGLNLSETPPDRIRPSLPDNDRTRPLPDNDQNTEIV